MVEGDPTYQDVTLAAITLTVVIDNVIRVQVECYDLGTLLSPPSHTSVLKDRQRQKAMHIRAGWAGDCYIAITSDVVAGLFWQTDVMHAVRTGQGQGRWSIAHTIRIRASHCCGSRSGSKHTDSYEQTDQAGEPSIGFVHCCHLSVISVLLPAYPLYAVELVAVDPRGIAIIGDKVDSHECPDVSLHLVRYK